MMSLLLASASGGGFWGWLFGGLTGVLTTFVQWIFSLGGAIFGWLLAGALQYIVEPLLKATIFDTYGLTGTGLVATVAGDVWRFMLGVSAAVALAGLVYGALSGQFGKISGKGGTFASHGDVLDGLFIYVTTVVGGYYFLSLLLNVANSVTNGLFGVSKGLLNVVAHNPVVASTATGAAVVAYEFFLPVTGLVLAGVLVWLVFTWLSRMVDIIFYVGVLPLTAALAITGNKRAFQWNFAEAQGAIFSQLAMAVMWWIAALLLGSPVPTNAYTTATGALAVQSSPSLASQVAQALHSYGGAVVTHAASTAGMSSISASILHLALGIVAMAMVSRAPQMLQSITGHQYAGVASMAMGVAAGSLMAGAARGAIGMSTGGQFLGQLKMGQEDKAKAKVASWGQPGASVGERFSNTALGKKLGAASSAAMSFAADKAGNVAETIGGSKAGQYAKGVGQAFATGTTAGVGITSAARAVAPHARRLGRAGVGAARTAASMVYQPRTTMGRMMHMSMGEQVEAREAVSDTQVAATYGVMSAHFKPKDAIDKTAAALGMKPEGVSKVMGIPKADGPQPKNAPPPSRNQKLAAFVASKHRQRHRPANGNY